MVRNVRDPLHRLVQLRTAVPPVPQAGPAATTTVGRRPAVHAAAAARPRRIGRRIRGGRRRRRRRRRLVVHQSGGAAQRRRRHTVPAARRFRRPLANAARRRQRRQAVMVLRWMRVQWMVLPMMTVHIDDSRMRHGSGGPGGGGHSIGDRCDGRRRRRRRWHMMVVVVMMVVRLMDGVRMIGDRRCAGDVQTPLRHMVGGRHMVVMVVLEMVQLVHRRCGGRR